MKAITIRQPWASLIALGIKQVETRSWSTKHRGRIAIHAGLRDGFMAGQYGRGHSSDSNALWRLKNPCDLREGEDGFDVIGTAPLGVIVATAKLVDCVRVDELAAAGPATGWSHRSSLSLDLYAVGDDQIPLGDFEANVGQYAWLLGDIKPTAERCPRCWGDGGFQEDSMILYGVPGGMGWGDPCPTCNPSGRRTEPLGVGAYGCDPIPAKGKQGLWEWTP